LSEWRKKQLGGKIYKRQSKSLSSRAGTQPRRKSHATEVSGVVAAIAVAERAEAKLQNAGAKYVIALGKGHPDHVGIGVAAAA
jgi:hypothetical protein